MSAAQVAFGRGRPALLGRISANDWVAVGAGVICALLFVMAVIGPLVAPHDPLAIDPLNVYASSSSAHIFGTDESGRDIFSRILAGARPSLAGPACVVLISTVFGTILALVSGWFGGWPDSIISRGMDILFAFPGLILAITAAAVFGPGLVAPVVALSIAYTPVLARLLRSAVQHERNLPYIAALRAQGASGWRITMRHIFPNVAPMLMVQATVAYGYAMVDLAAISYIGLGVQPPTADWGLMAANGQPAIIAGHPEQSIYASLMVLITVVAVNVVGERLAQRFEVQGLP